MRSQFLFRLFFLSFIIFVLCSNRFWATKMIELDNSISEGGGILNYAALLVVLVSFLWFIRSIKHIHVRGIHRICILWFLIMPVIMFLSHAQKSYYIMTILWPLLFEVGYIMTGIEGIELKHIRKLFIVVFFVGLFFFLQSKLHANRIDQTNTIYFPLLTAPFLLCYSNKRLQTVILIGISLLSIWSFKRGVLLIVLLVWLFYFWQTVRGKRNVLAIIVIAGVFLLGSIYTLKRMDQASGGVITARAEKTQDDEGGGRLNIWTIVVAMIDVSSPTQKIIGHGHFGVSHDSPLGLSAHNDFLEVIYDYGLIVFFLYLLLWLYVIKRLRFHIKNNTTFVVPYFFSFAIFLLMSMVSHLILYCSYFNYLVLFWGCMEGLMQKSSLSINSIQNEGIVCNERVPVKEEPYGGEL